MGLREKINQNQGLGIVLAVGLFVVAVVGVVYEVRPRALPERKVYFFDLGSNQLFGANQSQVPPIPAPSGPGNEAVRAYVYCCGSCDDASKQVIQYLEKYTPEAKTAMKAAPNTQNMEAGFTGHLVSNKEGKKWVKADSPVGQALTHQGGPLCGPTGALRDCEPGQ